VAVFGPEAEVTLIIRMRTKNRRKGTIMHSGRTVIPLL